MNQDYNEEKTEAAVNAYLSNRLSYGSAGLAGFLGKHAVDLIRHFTGGDRQRRWSN